MNDMFKQRNLFLKEFHEKVKKPKIDNTSINIPSGMFHKCPECNQLLENDDLADNLFICPHCENHFRIDARTRLKLTVDKDSFKELFIEFTEQDPLKFPGYKEKLSEYRKKTNEKEAFICGTGIIKGINVAIGVLDSYFMMGSMGKTVGDKVSRLANYAKNNSLPLVIFSASGGARMQEGMFSLMQMAKTSGAIQSFSDNGGLYISVLTNPTTGGVAASFAMLGDINVAEQGALIGFAGQKVIKSTIRQDLPEGFQTAEFQKAHGFVDLVENRKNLVVRIAELLKFHETGESI